MGRNPYASAVHISSIAVELLCGIVETFLEGFGSDWCIDKRLSMIISTHVLVDFIPNQHRKNGTSEAGSHLHHPPLNSPSLYPFHIPRISHRLLSRDQVVHSPTLV